MNASTFGLSGNILNVVQETAHQASVSEQEIRCWQMTASNSNFFILCHELMVGKYHE